MAFNNAQLHPAAVFSNKGFSSPAAYSRYLRRFRDRPIQPSFSIQPSGFTKYDLNVSSLIDNLGWGSLTEDMRFSFCPEVVRLFYVNLVPGPGCDPAFFTTTVFNYDITVTPALLANLLDLPHTGLRAGTDGEFISRGFRFDIVLDRYTRDIGDFYPSPLAAGRLPDDLKVLHFFITRLFLPRDLSASDILHSADLWILSNAKEGRLISYASLMFSHLIKFGIEYYSGPLPFGPQITNLLHKVGIDLRDKVMRCNVLDDLRPQHVLAKLNAEVGPRKPIIGSGGVITSPAAYASGKFVDSLVDAAVTVIKQGATGSGKQSTALKRLREQDLMWPKFVYEAGAVNDSFSSDSESEESEEGDRISEYESPPEYPF
ncbi:unnamed protein product [Linum trigynum]|uniref:Uncharacterized protein n=1 Tax=Linum trigynum TaxID=586398 RepID=A0AAV2CFX1_9ROSI